MKYLKLPPYGKLLLQYLEKEKKLPNDIFLCLGKNAWTLAQYFSKAGQLVLLLPPDNSPLDYYWPVQNCDVLALVTTETSVLIIEQMAYQLLCAQANVVRVILNWNGTMPAIYRRGEL